jgi:HlyD family secretion protein
VRAGSFRLRLVSIEQRTLVSRQTDMIATGFVFETGVSYVSEGCGALWKAKVVELANFTCPSNRKVLIALGLILACSVAGSAFSLHAEDMAPASRAKFGDEKRWQAIAPGRVEPISGEIKVVASKADLIGEVLVKAGDKVSAGEPLVRLHDPEFYARLDSVEAQVAMRKRARDDQGPSSRATDRRKAEDAVADAEQSVLDARAAFDRTSLDKRAGRASEPDLDSARFVLLRAEHDLTQQSADLHKLEADRTTPLPTQAEGQLNVARAQLRAEHAAIEKLTIRAPITGTVLEVNGKPGEMASPSAPQPLVLLGDVSALRVRAELDERDFGETKIGQAVSVRPEAFPGRELPGTVSFIAPIVEPPRTGSRGQRDEAEIDVVEVLIELADPGPLVVGMKVNAYFRYDGAGSQH